MHRRTTNKPKKKTGEENKKKGGVAVMLLWNEHEDSERLSDERSLEIVLRCSGARCVWVSQVNCNSLRRAQT